MQVRERMIRERFASQLCEGCGHSYGQGTVLVLARRPAAWLVLASCGQCEHRCIYLVSFREATREAEGHRIESEAPPLSVRRAYALTDQPATHPSAKGAVTDDEVTAMRAFLAGFNGDFRHLFGTDDHSLT